MTPNNTITQKALAQSVYRSFVRSGEEGGCVACQRPVSDHFDKTGGWLGCPSGDAETTFILVPVRTVRSKAPVVETLPSHPMRRATDRVSGNGTGSGSVDRRGTLAGTTSANAGNNVPVRTIRSAKPVLRSRFLYRVSDRRLRPELSPIRARVYETLLANPDGLVSRQLMQKTKLVHGSIQQTLNWLRNQDLVSAEEVG